MKYRVSSIKCRNGELGGESEDCLSAVGREGKGGGGEARPNWS